MTNDEHSRGGGTQRYGTLQGWKFSSTCILALCSTMVVGDLRRGTSVALLGYLNVRVIEY